MASVASRSLLASTSKLASTRCIGLRAVHSSSSRRAVSPFHMPAMSPTMTEGGIASWKKKEGESFAAGDVLLEIETDKATIDVEAQEDGVLGKIIAPDGTKNVPVGRLIALLAENGDDISTIEVPAEGTSAAAPSREREAPKQVDLPPVPSQPSPSFAAKGPIDHIHVPGPVFPSVLRLLNEHQISDFKQISGTGIRGMLTKGDVLAFLGKASTPTGTFKRSPTKVTDLAGPAAPAVPKKEVQPLDGLTLRQLIATGLSDMSGKRNLAPKGPAPTFDSIIADYLPKSAPKAHPVPSQTTPSTPNSHGYLNGLI